MLALPINYFHAVFVCIYPVGTKFKFENDCFAMSSCKARLGIPTAFWYYQNKLPNKCSIFNRLLSVSLLFLCMLTITFP